MTYMTTATEAGMFPIHFIITKLDTFEAEIKLAEPCEFNRLRL